MIVLLTITVDSRGARVTVIRYVPIWVRHPDFMVLPAGTAWRADPADAAALRASYEARSRPLGAVPDPADPRPAVIRPVPPGTGHSFAGVEGSGQRTVELP